MNDNDADAPFSPPDNVPFSNQIDYHDVNNDEIHLWDHHDAASTDNHTAANDNQHQHHHQHQHLQFIIGDRTNPIEPSPDEEDGAYPRSHHQDKVMPNHRNSDDSTKRGNQDADGLPTADDNDENENKDDDADDDVTVIPLPFSTQYALNQNSTLSTLIPPPPPPSTTMMNTLTWLEQPTTDMEQMRRRIIHVTLCRVERNAALTMACLCLVPVLLALVIVITAREFMGPASHCQDPSVLAMNVTCRQLPRQFLNAFASQCVCDGVAMTIRQQYIGRREL